MTVSAPFHYRAFGLTFRSEFPLSAFESAPPGPADVTISRGDTPPPSGQTRPHFSFAPDDARMAWPVLGEFRILGTDRITVSLRPDADLRLLEHPLTGPVLAMLLHRRGLLVLHASAVSVAGRAVALLGDKGAGKSTTAGALLRAGHGLLSDDVVAIDLDAGEAPLILPAFGQIKLTETASAALALRAEIRERLHPSIAKRPHVLAGGTVAGPVPAAALFVLERGEPHGIAPLAGGTAVAQLVRFSYAMRFGRSATPPEMAARHLRLCAQLASRAEVARLRVPDGLERLETAVRDIENRCGAASDMAG